MEKDLQIGAEAELKASVAGGLIKLQIDQVGKIGSVGAYICASPDQVCEALADLIPGDSAAEHSALGLVKMALNAAMG